MTEPKVFWESQTYIRKGGGDASGENTKQQTDNMSCSKPNNTCPKSLSGSSTTSSVCQPAAVTHASAAVKGSRKSNEDCGGSVLLEAYAFSVVCDGHSGVTVATTLGKHFIESLRLQLESISATAQVSSSFMYCTRHIQSLSGKRLPGLQKREISSMVEPLELC